ncbi:hypothetical protein IMZ48_15925 [Candidatus Bathyarchaeota archaeon]|nr:hypothetical protein [Candidatus Bathyarchaeota archaeon]
MSHNRQRALQPCLVFNPPSPNNPSASDSRPPSPPNTRYENKHFDRPAEPSYSRRAMHPPPPRDPPS